MTGRCAPGWSARARRASLPVRFAGFVTDPKELAILLASADVVIAPGPVETFGLAALEALACGTPVVVSASSALPEVVATAGIAVTGEDFAGGVRAIMARDPIARRAAARTRAEEFGWPASVTAFLTVHEALNTDSFASRAGASMTRIVTLGDSITLGMGDPDPSAAGEAGHGTLAAGLPDPELHNLAVLGAQAKHVERDQLPAALELRPDVATVVVGHQRHAAGRSTRWAPARPPPGRSPRCRRAAPPC